MSNFGPHRAVFTEPTRAHRVQPEPDSLVLYASSEAKAHQPTPEEQYDIIASFAEGIKLPEKAEANNLFGLQLEPSARHEDRDDKPNDLGWFILSCRLQQLQNRASDPKIQKEADEGLEKAVKEKNARAVLKALRNSARIDYIKDFALINNAGKGTPLQKLLMYMAAYNEDPEIMLMNFCRLSVKVEFGAVAASSEMLMTTNEKFLRSAANQRREGVLLALKCGADVNCNGNDINDFNFSPAIHSVQDIALLETLYKLGLNIEAPLLNKTASDTTALTMAENPDKIQWLISKGAKVNLKVGYSESSILYQQQNPLCAALLIAAGINVAAKGKSGATALARAGSNVCQLIVNSGVKPSKLDESIAVSKPPILTYKDFLKDKVDKHCNDLHSAFTHLSTAATLGNPETQKRLEREDKVSKDKPKTTEAKAFFTRWNAVPEPVRNVISDPVSLCSVADKGLFAMLKAQRERGAVTMAVNASQNAMLMMNFPVIARMHQHVHYEAAAEKPVADAKAPAMPVERKPAAKAQALLSFIQEQKDGNLWAKMLGEEARNPVATVALRG